MKKVIMILTNRFDPDVRVYKEAKYLVKNGFEVEILCWDRESHYPSDELTMLEGIKIKRFYPYAKYGSGIKQIGPLIKFVAEVKKYLSKTTYDYLHCHDLDGAIVGNLIKKKNTKMIFDMHEYYEVQGSKQKIRRLIRGLVSYIQTKAEYIIYVNSQQLTHMKNSNKSKLIFLPNFPEVENYIGLSKSKSKELRISYIGAVRHFNELNNLIEAAKGIDNLHISIHGEGIAYKKLKLVSENLENVNVTGVFNYNQAGFLFGECDILYAVYPIHTLQNRIAYPVKFFEALASNTPLIVSKGTILEEEVTKKEIGFTVDGNSVDEIKKLLIYINENRDLLKEKEKNIDKIKNDFQWETVVKNLDKIYFR